MRRRPGAEVRRRQRSVPNAASPRRLQEAAVRRAASGFVVDLHSRRGVLKGVAKARTVEAAKRAAEHALGL